MIEEEIKITPEDRKLDPEDYEIYMNPRIMAETDVKLYEFWWNVRKKNMDGNFAILFQESGAWLEDQLE